MNMLKIVRVNSKWAEQYARKVMGVVRASTFVHAHVLEIGGCGLTGCPSEVDMYCQK